MFSDEAKFVIRKRLKCQSWRNLKCKKRLVSFEGQKKRRGGDFMNEKAVFKCH
jgi:hypothetical protein